MPTRDQIEKVLSEAIPHSATSYTNVFIGWAADVLAQSGVFKKVYVLYEAEPFGPVQDWAIYSDRERAEARVRELEADEERFETFWVREREVR